jgi:putative copper resistance protein D
MALLLSFGAAAMLRPTVSLAVPTSFTRPAVSYSVSSVAAGMDLYAGHCASCHGPLAPGSGGEASASDLLTPEITDRSAGELFWAVTRGRPDRGMPAFADTLTDAQRWQLINAVRAAEASARARMVGPVVEFDGAWLPAPDFTVAVGPLLPRRLSEFRGRKMVLLVLYQLPLSRERLTDLAKRYGSLSVLGVEVVAVGPASSPDRIAELGQTPPILFPIVTDANEEIASVYGLFAPRGAHRELLIDRQGYIRAVWDTDEAGMPSADAVQAQVERLNEEKSPPPVPDDHVH